MFVTDIQHSKHQAM